LSLLKKYHTIKKSHNRKTSTTDMPNKADPGLKAVIVEQPKKKKMQEDQQQIHDIMQGVEVDNSDGVRRRGQSSKSSSVWERNNKQKIMQIVKQDEMQSFKEDPEIFSMDEDVDEVEMAEFGFDEGPLAAWIGWCCTDLNRPWPPMWKAQVTRLFYTLA
jgi:hypothetical protein